MPKWLRPDLNHEEWLRHNEIQQAKSEARIQGAIFICALILGGLLLKAYLP
jgi:hypothetical protein